MVPSEQFECANCGHTGELDLHGRCGCCQSLAVMSLEKAEALILRTIAASGYQAVPA